MSQQSKREVVKAIRRHYRGANRTQKSFLLNRLCDLTGYDRKHAIKLLNGRVGKGKGRAGRRKRYGPEVVEPLKAIWLASEQLCSKRLKPALPLWLPAYEEVHGALPTEVRRRLLEVSPAQIDRLLAPFRAETSAWRRTGPKPGTLIRKQIPVRSEPWAVDEAGWLEADAVAHCGGSMAGNFVWSITLTDIDSGWTSLRATWNRGQHGVLEQIKDIERHLPFALLGFDCDNGGEFLNAHLLAYLRQREAPVQFTRSRPYRKNDNAHVEQKNWTHVRQLLGYERLNDPLQVEPINRLYKEAWEPLHNFFMPSCKLVAKEKTRDGRWHKVYDAPRTPCDRLLARPGLPPTRREWLQHRRVELNPFVLKARVEELLGEVQALAHPPAVYEEEGTG